MKNKIKKEYKVSAWAVVNSSYLIEEVGAFGNGGSIKTSKIRGVYSTKREAENMRLRWKNSDDFKTVKCQVVYIA